MRLRAVDVDAVYLWIEFETKRERERIVIFFYQRQSMSLWKSNDAFFSRRLRFHCLFFDIPKSLSRNLQISIVILLPWKTERKRKRKIKYSKCRIISLQSPKTGYTGDIWWKAPVIRIQHTWFEHIFDQAPVWNHIPAMWSLNSSGECCALQRFQHGWLVVLNTFSATGVCRFEHWLQRNYHGARRRKRPIAAKSLHQIRIPWVNWQQAKLRHRWRW